MNLKLDTGDTIELPISIATSKLTLAQIGAVVLFSTFETLSQSDYETVPQAVELNNKIQSNEAQAAFAELRELGVLKASVDMVTKTVSVTMDLEAIGC
jgi:hypothetical protein